jgi:leucine dehydrogenase
MAAASASAAPVEIEHELLIVRRGPRSGAHTIVAVHSTVLGPALGGCRLWRYVNVQEAIDDALRLSRAMTLKAAAAGLSLGGGKAVVFPSEGWELTGPARIALLEDFAETVNMLDGRYITAEDVGTTAADMALLSELSPHVVGAPARQGGSGDPGEFTAAGVRAAMRACCARRFGAADLRGRSVAVVGLGHVGEPLARLLAHDGAELTVSDIDEERRAVARRLGARWAEPPEALRAEVDVLAPCAMGGVIDRRLASELRAKVVCGSANNQLADEELAEVLAARGVLYAPDFIVNSGGLINVALELSGYDRRLACRRTEAIEDVLERVFDRAERSSLTPLGAARELAQERIAAAARAARRRRRTRTRRPPRRVRVRG